MTTQIQLNLEKTKVLNCEETPKKGKEIIVNEKTLNPKKAVKPKKFIINPKFKVLLKSVLDNKGEEVGKIASAFLNKELVGADGLNYIGISEENNTKISYLDEARILKFEKLKDVYYEIHPTLELKATINMVRKIYWDSTPEVISDTEITQRITPKKFCIRLEDQGVTEKLKHVKVSSELELNNTDFFSVNDLILNVPNNVELIIYTESGTPDIKGKFTDKKLTINNPNTHTTISDLKFKLTQRMFPKVWVGKVRYHSTVGKLIRKLFGQEFTDKEISDFTDAYREFTMIGIPGYSYAEVTGEKIRENYHYVNYVSDNGTLGRSCMRQTEKQSFFKIYEESDCCRLATLYFQKKVAARCLLWTNENGTFRDRIYSVDEPSNAILKNLTNKYPDLYNDSSLRNNIFPVDAELVKSLNKAPYMDSLYYYDFDKNGLLGMSGSENYWKFQDQHGHIYKHTTNTCPHCGSTGEEEAETRDEEQGCLSCIVDTSRGNMFRDDDSIIYCEYGAWNYTPIDEAVELFDGSYVHENSIYLRQFENDYGYFMTNIHEFEEEGNLYYHEEDPQRPSYLRELEEQRVEEQLPETVEEEDDAF